MSTLTKHEGKFVEIDLLADLFPSEEGSIDIIYGRIGTGKTYNATFDIIERLKHGSVEYVNWPIDLSEFDFDQKDSKFFTFIGILGLKKRYYRFLKSNLHFYQISDAWARSQGYEDFMQWFSSRTDCVINADEGHVLFDSYAGTKMPIETRMSVLHTRHYNRRLIIISQRPTAIHVSARGNVNRFFKCEKLVDFLGLLIFRKSEFQDTTATGETVDDTVKPISTKWYFANKKVFRAYDTHYLRGGLETSQQVNFEAYDFKWRERLVAFLRVVAPRLMPRRVEVLELVPKWERPITQIPLSLSIKGKAKFAIANEIQRPEAP